MYTNIELIYQCDMFLISKENVFTFVLVLQFFYVQWHKKYILREEQEREKEEYYFNGGFIGIIFIDCMWSSS